jgi:hypothetical protein
MSNTEAGTEMQPSVGVLGVRWYHVGFALALGIGGAILPPAGATTIFGWVGGAVGSLTSAFVVVIAAVFVTRQFDDWRPADLAGYHAPDSRFKYLVFTGIVTEMFVLGTALTANVAFSTITYLLTPLNVVVAVTVLGDILRLRGRGIDFETVEFGYAAFVVLAGFLGGLAYWWRRGRKRAAWVEARTDADDADTSSDTAPAGTDGDAETDDTTE